MAQQYIASFLDPFDATYPQLKILDGSEPWSSGVRFRDSGTVTLDAAGGVCYMMLLPAYNNPMAYKRPADANWTPSSSNPTHVGSNSDRLNIKRIRMVSSGLKLQLLNSSLENEGIWEAVRIPVTEPDLNWDPSTFQSYPLATYSLPIMANHHTYQTGSLKDIDRFLFKLNSVAPDHPFDDLNATGADNHYDKGFDIIVLKLIGRVDATNPSVVRFQTVSNQEVVYLENTSLSRLATTSPMMPNMNEILNQTKFQLPAIQVS